MKPLPEVGASSRRVLLTLALSLVLATLSTEACKLLLEWLRGPAVWKTFFYIRWLLPPAWLGLWCLVLLPNEIRALVRRGENDSTAVLAWSLAVLLVSAAILTSGADLAFELSGSARLKRDIVLENAWATNILLLFSLYALAFAATRRIAAAQLVVVPLYCVLIFSTLAKIKYMHSGVQPLDLLRLPEFVPLFPSFFGTGTVIAALAAAGLWIVGLVIVGRTQPARVSPLGRLSTGGASLSFLLLLPVLFELAPSVSPAADLLRLLGAPEDQHRDKARLNGVLLTFVSELPTALVSSPPNYSAEVVANALSIHQSPAALAPRDPPSRVNLILYLVESFMDPDDLGFRYTMEPIPNIRAFGRSQIRGYGIVPERFGGSANTEFEVLTGMSMTFLPPGSLPFRQYIRHPLPSLPRLLGELGFTTYAIQADAKYYYNREEVYDLLGFQHVVWLNDTPGVERAARPGWPSDNAVVQAIVQASRGSHPFFAFAFPSSTHSPYTSGVYRDSELDVLDPATGDNGEVKEYVNTLRVADEAIGKLIDYFGQQPDSTIIAIMGDHLAPLSAVALGPFFARLSGLTETERARRTRRVPLLIWANFPLLREEPELSINALPAFLLEKMRLSPPGFLAITGEVLRRVPVVASYLQGPEGEIWRWDSLPAPERILLEDYRLLQYDLLLGKRYALRPDLAAPPPARRAAR